MAFLSSGRAVLVGAARHPVAVPILPLLPRLPIRTLDQLLACRQFVHEDRCRWMGEDGPPCTCGIPRLIEALAAVHGDQLGLNPPARHDSKT